MSNGAETRLRRTRARIIDAAEEVFPEHGFLGASMDAVAERASVSKQTVYAHFNNKEALFLEVVQSMTTEAASEIGEDRGDENIVMHAKALGLVVRSETIAEDTCVCTLLREGKLAEN